MIGLKSRSRPTDRAGDGGFSGAGKAAPGRQRVREFGRDRESFLADSQFGDRRSPLLQETMAAGEGATASMFNVPGANENSGAHNPSR